MSTTPIPHRWSIVVRGDKTSIVASVQSDGVLLGSEAAINDAAEWLLMFLCSKATLIARVTLKVWQDATNLDTFSRTATPAEILDEIDSMRDANAYARSVDTNVGYVPFDELAAPTTNGSGGC